MERGSRIDLNISGYFKEFCLGFRVSLKIIKLIIKNLDIANLTIRKAGEAMVRGDFTARELTDAYLAEIEKRNGELNAYLYVFTEHARVQAYEVDKKRAGG